MCGPNKLMWLIVKVTAMWFTNKCGLYYEPQIWLSKVSQVDRGAQSTRYGPDRFGLVRHRCEENGRKFGKIIWTIWVQKNTGQFTKN